MYFHSALQPGSSTGAGSAGGANDILLQLVVPLATPVLALVGVWYQGRQKSARRLKTLKEAVELYALLPDDVESRSSLREHIDRLVESYVTSRTNLRRDVPGLVFAAMLLFVGFWCGGLAIAYGGWWNTFWLPSSFFLLFGSIGFTSSWPKKNRDERGHKVEPEPATDN